MLTQVSLGPGIDITSVNLVVLCSPGVRVKYAKTFFRGILYSSIYLPINLEATGPLLEREQRWLLKGPLFVFSFGLWTAAFLLYLLRVSPPCVPGNNSSVCLF